MNHQLKDLIDRTVADYGCGIKRPIWRGVDERESAIVSAHADVWHSVVETATMSDARQVIMSMEEMIASPCSIPFEEYFSVYPPEKNRRFAACVNRYSIIAYVVEGGIEGIYLHIEDWDWRDSAAGRQLIFIGKTLNEKWRTEMWQMAGRIQWVLSR